MVYKFSFVSLIILIGFIASVSSCTSIQPVSDTVERYTFQKETVGMPPWQKKWERKHQPEDPDWRWNMPWFQERYAKENIEYTDQGVKIWARNGKEGCLYSNFNFKYGKVAAKIRLPNEEGAWSAFWLFGESGMPENDALEHCGGESYVNVTHHWGYNYESSGFKKQTTHNKRRGINPNDWNIYEVEVTPYKTIYRINGKTVRTIKRGTSSDKRHILLTCGWGFYCGDKTPDAFMEVQWLTVEKYK